MQIIKKFIKENRLSEIYDIATLACEKILHDEYEDDDEADAAAIYYEEIKECFQQIEELSKRLNSLNEAQELHNREKSIEELIKDFK